MAEYYKGLVRQATPGVSTLQWQKPQITEQDDLKFSSISEIDRTLDAFRFRICAPLNGTETYRVEGELRTVKPGQYLILNPQQHARGEGDLGKTVDGICIFLTEATLAEAALGLQLPLSKKTETNFSNTWQQHDFIDKNYHLQENIFGQHLQSILSKLTGGGEIFIDWDAFYFDIAAHFLRAHYQIGEQLEAIPYTQMSTKREIFKRISLVHNYISDNFASPVSLDELVRIAFFSKYHVVRLYRLLYGITPYQHILQLRIREAKVLLQKDFDPKEVAFMLSFSDRSSFSKTFKKMTGMSPTCFRENLSHRGAHFKK